MSDIAAQDDLRYEVRDHIGYIVFNRPHARNALTFAMYERVAEICETVNKSGSVKVLVLSGAGDKAFASGTDISQFRAFKTPQDALDYEARIDRVLGTLEQTRVPTIAAIAGACTGGGAGFPIARTLGNCLAMSNLGRLAALIGPARVKDVIFTARLVEAPEALHIGLISEMVEPAELMHRAEALARLIAGHAPLTLRATKEALRRLRQNLSRQDGEDLVLMCYMSRDFREGMDAFLNKRTPQWTGE